jgi:integrase
MLIGTGLSDPEIKTFSIWLGNAIKERTGGGCASYYLGQVFRSCGNYVVESVRRHVKVEGDGHYNVVLMKIVAAHRACWDSVVMGGYRNLVSTDLTDREIEILDANLYCGIESGGVVSSTSVRNYLLWRLIKAFGLRIGEALALRLEDINITSNNPCLNIVHLDERGDGYFDPRTPYHPRVKTLSRTLYFMSQDEDVVDLIDDYLENHRLCCRVVRGRKILTNMLSHDYLFIEHGKVHEGRPMSSSAASKLAKQLARDCNIDFHWHIVRHSVFNRLYAAAAMLLDNKSEIDHIVYLGGWRSEKSLEIYNRRATRDRALTELKYQNRLLIGE